MDNQSEQPIVSSEQPIVSSEQPAHVGDNEPSSRQDQLHDAFFGLIATMIVPQIVDYVNKTHPLPDGKVVTVDEVITNVLSAPSSLTVNIAVQSTKDVAKKAERDEEGGCQRIMGARAKLSGKPCGEKVFKNATGEPALFCAKCMRLKTFNAQVFPLLKAWDLTMSQATAGKKTDGQGHSVSPVARAHENPVTPPNRMRPASRQPQPIPEGPCELDDQDYEETDEATPPPPSPSKRTIPRRGAAAPPNRRQITNVN